MVSVFVAAEGFTLPGQFIVKELTLLFENEDFSHFMFEPPLDYEPTSEEIKTIIYTTSHIHGLNYTDGELSYAKLKDVLGKLHNCKVFCCGENTRGMLQKYIPTTPVTNIKKSGCIIPTALPPSSCGRTHLGRNCSMSKATMVKNFCMYNN